MLSIILLLWKWVNVSSIAVFARKVIGVFFYTHKDALYNTLNRDDIKWRDFNMQVTRRVHERHDLYRSRTRVSSIKVRQGKKIKAISGQFDHVSNCHVLGPRVLTLDLTTGEVFPSLDSQIYISTTKAD